MGRIPCAGRADAESSAFDLCMHTGYPQPSLQGPRGLPKTMHSGQGVTVGWPWLNTSSEAEGTLADLPLWTDLVAFRKPPSRSHYGNFIHNFQWLTWMGYVCSTSNRMCCHLFTPDVELKHPSRPCLFSKLKNKRLYLLGASRESVIPKYLIHTHFSI